MNNRDERKANNRRTLTAFTISLALHLFLFGGGLYVNYQMNRDLPRLKAIDVTLVALPGPGSRSEQEMTDAPVSVAEPEPEVVSEPQVPEPKPVIEPEPKPQPQPKPVKKVPKKIPEEPKKAEKNLLEKRLEALQETVKQEEPTEFERRMALLEKKTQEGPPSDIYKRSGPGSLSGEGGYGAPMSAFEAYAVMIRTIIKNNWDFTGQLIRNKQNIKAYVAFTILPGGAISDITLDQASSSKYFDDTVLKALEKSSPLPAVPDEVSRGPLRIGFVFTPQGIE